MKTYLVIIIAFFLSSCALIEIGKKPQKVVSIEYHRKDPVGAVLLFKNELDADNIVAATEYLASNTGGRILAVNKLDIYDTLPMLQNKLRNLKISNIYQSDLGNDIIQVNIEFGYIRNLICDTKKIDSLFFILDYKFEKHVY